MGCTVSGKTLQYRLEECISHWRTQQVTQLFTYLLTALHTATYAAAPEQLQPVLQSPSGTDLVFWLTHRIVSG